MKKTILLILCFSLLLTACSGPKAPESTEAAGTTASTALPSAAPTAPSDEPTAAPSAEPTATEPPVTEPPATEPPAYSAAGSRTSGGVFVHTDPSAYVPYGGFGAKYTRLREGPLDHFEPSEDYGAVYPYVASWVNRPQRGEEWEYKHEVFTYGFVDARGRILTDDIYESAYPLPDSDWDTVLPCAYWLVSRFAGIETYQWGDPSWDEYRDAPVHRYGLISADGSFALDCEYNRIYDTGNGICCVKDGDLSNYTVYDRNWNLLFTGADVVAGLEAQPTTMTLCYGDGLYLADTWIPDSDEPEAFYSGVHVCWFCDGTGKRVLGPYQTARPFRSGAAYVEIDENRHGYIDKTGAWIPTLSDVKEDLENGMTVVSIGEGRLAVLDRDGAKLFEMEGENAVAVPCGYHSWSSNYPYHHEWFYDEAGNLLIDGDEIGERVTCLDATTFYYFKDGRVLYVVSPERILLCVETWVKDYGDGWYGSPVELQRGAFWQDGELLMGWYGGQTADQSRRIFIPEDCSGVITYREPTPPTTHYRDTYLTAWDSLSEKIWYFCWTGTAWEGRTEDGERCTVPLRAASVVPMGDLIRVYTEDASCFLRYNGETVFRYPLDVED